MLTPVVGIAATLGIDGAQEAAARVWDAFARSETVEDKWWRALGDELGHAIPLDRVREAEERLLQPYRWAAPLLDGLADAVDRLGIVSDNTSFWFDKQDQMLGLARRQIDPLLLSFRSGLRKSDRPRGLYDVAAEMCDPAMTLVVDDRDRNVERAREAGFHVLKF